MRVQALCGWERQMLRSLALNFGEVVSASQTHDLCHGRATCHCTKAHPLL